MHREILADEEEDNEFFSVPSTDFVFVESKWKKGLYENNKIKNTYTKEMYSWKFRDGSLAIFRHFSHLRRDLRPTAVATAAVTSTRDPVLENELRAEALHLQV